MSATKKPTFKVEPHYSVIEVRERFFPGRCERWIVDRVKRGEFGPAAKDTGGWLIPESGILAYLQRHIAVAIAA